MTFSRKILVGLVSGIALGIFLGEAVAPLKIAADGFVKLLQMTVLPYVTVSIISSLGGLSFDEARTLGRKLGAVLAGLWLIALLFAFLIPLAFPPLETASFFSTSLLTQPAAFNFVDLYIPSNPFHSLANNVVPAVVLFSVMLGIALIGMERKQVLLDPLHVAGQALARTNRYVVTLTPYGLFAIAASTAGTIDIEQVERLQVFLITYVAVAMLVALWVLPGLVAALTPIGYREVFGPFRDAFITAFIAADLFMVLPILIEACRGLLERHRMTDHHTASLPDVIVPASFNFPHTGKLLSLSFVLFAGWFADAAVTLPQYPQLAFTGFLTFFASLNAAIPFLLDLFRIPADTFQLFLAAGVINSRVGTLVAAVHTVAVALLGSAAIAGALRFNAARVGRYVFVTVLLTAATLGGLRLTFATVLAHEFKGEGVVYGMSSLLVHEPSKVVDAVPEVDATAATGSVLATIRARGVLRVAFVPMRMPYAFLNGAGELVGLDVELAHLLARDLGVGVEFVSIPSAEAVDVLTSGACDLIIGGHPVTPRRMLAARFSAPYLDSTLSFVVKDHLRARFESWASIREIHDLRVGVLPLPYYIRELRDRAPQLTFSELAPEVDPLDARLGLDAVMMPGERGSVLTLLHPQWTVVVPEPGIVKIPLAWPLARHDEEWATFVNTWIRLKQSDGTIDALNTHWILGKSATRHAPRWSIVRDVLHWID